MPIIPGIPIDADGRYHVERKIGAHSDTAPVQVYLARDTQTDQDIVAKVFSYQPNQDQFMQNGLARFKREMAILQGMRHPGIVPILASGQAERRLWMILPYYPKGTLMDLMDQRRGVPLAIPDACGFTIRIARALAAGHDQPTPIIHRDVKPHNILIDAEDNALLCDYGIAHLLGGEHFTQLDKAVGTPECMAPEQIEPRHFGDMEHIDGRTDCYGLACCLYWMLCGHPPFGKATPNAMALAHLQLVPKPLYLLNARVNRGLTIIIARALEKSPAHRYAHINDFADALAPFVEAP